MFELPDGEELRHSRVLNLDRMATGPNLKAALVDLLVQLKEAQGSRQRARKASDEERLVTMLDAIVCDLFANYRNDPELFLGYSRDTSAYTRKSRYAHPLSSITAVTTVADFLIDAGYALGRKGFYDRASNPFGGPPTRSMRSRIKATEKLIQFLEGDHGASTVDISHRPGFEVIRLKDKAKRVIDYTDTAATEGMRSFLTRYNELIAGCDIQLDDGASLLSDDGIAPDFASKRLYRVFNNGRFDQGGRFYGGWWQLIGPHRRAHILIDGEETVEVDYSGMHGRMCYDLAGRSLDPGNDPYLIPGLEELRDAVKYGFLVLINLGPGHRAPATDKVKAQIKGRISFGDLLKAIERHHSVIRESFRSGSGIKLQWIDSEIASSVMAYFVGKGIPCLPIHDSFIVPSSARKQLEDAMQEEYAAYVRSPTSKACYPVLK
jgi:hypothetical protein